MVSDLHIGSSARADLLRRPEVRRALADRLRDGVDRLVILGDALELRDGPVHEAARDAEPVLRDLGEALGADGEIVLAGGNHDHNLLTGWIEDRLEQNRPMGLEQRIEPGQAGPVAARLAEAAAPARLTLAYPGLWLRDDVYAFHGHYLDLHSRTPTIERLAAGSMARALTPIPEQGAVPDDYEACLAPLYAWMHALAQRSRSSITKAGSRSSVNLWKLLAGEGRRERPVRSLVLRGGVRAAVGALNRTGIGPLSGELSGAALRRGSLLGVADVLERLGVDAPHVLFGHTHRAGPWEEDDQAEWHAGRSRLTNTGSWVYQRHFLSVRPGVGPYWPGTAVFVGESGPPVLERLLADRTHAQLRPPPAPAARG